MQETTMRKCVAVAVFLFSAVWASQAAAEIVVWEGRTFETVNVRAAIVTLRGEQVLKVERDLESFPFDPAREVETVDDRHYLKLKGFEFTDGIFEVKVLSRVLQPTPFPRAQGFIGVYFRAQPDDSAWESIYLRPNVGRSNIQAMRNHAVQYFAYPGFKFADSRKEAPGLYETYADIGLDEWITMRIHVAGQKAELYLNDARYPSFIVNTLKGTSKAGTIGLYVDIGTEGYFKDFRIISSIPPGGAGAR
jgi:Domain of Unknown Function (DUF1080)